MANPSLKLAHAIYCTEDETLLGDSIKAKKKLG
jgi:hypothetical protein